MDFRYEEKTKSVYVDYCKYTDNDSSYCNLFFCTEQGFRIVYILHRTKPKPKLNSRESRGEPLMMWHMSGWKNKMEDPIV